MSEHDRSHLGPYVLGGLEPDEIREVDEHLAGCAECREELAELEEMKEFLDEVPPEAFLDGPPPDGDLLLQRTLREVRGLESAPPAAVEPAKRSRWLVVAAAVVVIAGVLGGGVLIGRQSVDTPVAGPTTTPPTTPVAGTKQVTATDAGTGTTMATTVEPRGGWSWIDVKVSGLKVGAECEMVVTDKAGKTYVAGSWVVGEKGAREGSRFAGGVLVPIDEVKSVEIKTVQGAHVITAGV